MKCLVIVDPQNDFLPGGTFNAPAEYLDILHRINSIRLKLFGCSYKDTVTLRRSFGNPSHGLKPNDKHSSDEDGLMDVAEVCARESIKEYYECQDYIECENEINELHMFPFDNEGNPLNPGKKNSSVKTDAGKNGDASHYLHPEQTDLKTNNNNETENLQTQQNKVKGQKALYNFALHIITMDCHPPLHVSLAETHRICYEKICNNKYNKYKIENHEQVTLEEKIKKTEISNGVHNSAVHFTEPIKINNMSDVLNNLDIIHDTRSIYSFVNSVHDIREFESLQFLNETIDIWPVHCIQKSHGYRIHKNFIRHKNDLIIQKGLSVNEIGYSLFENRKRGELLLDILKRKNITEMYLCGFIFEYCVKFQALDFLKLKFKTYIIEDATGFMRPSKETVNYLNKMGIELISSQDLFK